MFGGNIVGGWNGTKDKYGTCFTSREGCDVNGVPLTYGDWSCGMYEWLLIHNPSILIHGEDVGVTL